MLTALVYLAIIAVIFITLMRLRKIAMTPKNGPRVHRSTYRKA
jgi:hypothetical protein